MKRIKSMQLSVLLSIFVVSVGHAMEEFKAPDQSAVGVKLTKEEVDEAYAAAISVTKGLADESRQKKVAIYKKKIDDMNKTLNSDAFVLEATTQSLDFVNQKSEQQILNEAYGRHGIEIKSVSPPIDVVGNSVGSQAFATYVKNVITRDADDAKKNQGEQKEAQFHKNLKSTPVAVVSNNTASVNQPVQAQKVQLFSALQPKLESQAQAQVGVDEDSSVKVQEQKTAAKANSDDAERPLEEGFSENIETAKDQDQAKSTISKLINQFTMIFGRGKTLSKDETDKISEESLAVYKKESVENKPGWPSRVYEAVKAKVMNAFGYKTNAQKAEKETANKALSVDDDAKKLAAARAKKEALDKVLQEISTQKTQIQSHEDLIKSQQDRLDAITKQIEVEQAKLNKLEMANNARLDTTFFKLVGRNADSAEIIKARQSIETLTNQQSINQKQVDDLNAILKEKQSNLQKLQAKHDKISENGIVDELEVAGDQTKEVIQEKTAELKSKDKVDAKEIETVEDIQAGLNDKSLDKQQAHDKAITTMKQLSGKLVDKNDKVKIADRFDQMKKLTIFLDENDTQDKNTIAAINAVALLFKEATFLNILNASQYIGSFPKNENGQNLSVTQIKAIITDKLAKEVQNK